jgi:hypothetical protein
LFDELDVAVEGFNDLPQSHFRRIPSVLKAVLEELLPLCDFYFISILDASEARF